MLEDEVVYEDGRKFAMPGLSIIWNYSEGFFEQGFLLFIVYILDNINHLIILIHVPVSLSDAVFTLRASLHLWLYKMRV